MSTPPRILAMAGSTRSGSFNKLLANIAAEGARAAGGQVTTVDLRDYPMPLFDGDLERASGLPEQATQMKKLFHEHDGLLIASPEYNSSITGVLKNTLDWVSRPGPGAEKALACFEGKTAVLMAASPGALGGLRALVHLRSILGNIKVLVLPDQIAIPLANEAFENGNLKDAKLAERVRALGARLVEVTGKLASK